MIPAVLVGVACFAGMGFGITALIRSAEGASAVVNLIVLPMAFLSGSFGPTRKYPEVLRWLADLLPLTYLIRPAQGRLPARRLVLRPSEGDRDPAGLGPPRRHHRVAPLRLGATRAVSELPFGAAEIVAAVAGAERVLDAGCGSGRLTVALALGGAAVTGIDTNAAQLEVAAQRAAEAGVCSDAARGRLQRGAARSPTRRSTRS